MKKILFTTILILICAAMFAQAQREDYIMVDSLVYRPASAVDSSLVGKSIFTVLDKTSGEVRIHQSQIIADGLKNHIARNAHKSIPGYRVRIFFDNQQNARGASESAQRLFSARYPGIAAYRSYQNPFFKVTVGDFRTKSEALELLQSIKRDFPTAFVVKENINYPVVDKSHSYVVDTVKVFRPKR
ncbi:MAG: SPOR domain-containing protein [Bacteroidales bacterium]|nr:SPOR domain-containing protein [Bacteroidales bacterium]